MENNHNIAFIRSIYITVLVLMIGGLALIFLPGKKQVDLDSTNRNVTSVYDQGVEKSTIELDDLNTKLQERISTEKLKYGLKIDDGEVGVAVSIHQYLDKLIAVSYTISKYYEGAAYPNNVYIYKTYDATTAEEISLTRFVPEQGDRYKLAERVLESIKTERGALLDQATIDYLETMPIDELLQNYEVKKDTVYFHLNGLAHALGDYSVPVSIDSIDGWVIVD